MRLTLFFIAKIKNKTKSFVALIAVTTALLCCFGLTSCIKEDLNVQLADHQLSPNIALPVVHSRMSLWQILNDYDSTDLFVEDGTRFLYIVYKGTVFSQRADELIKIPTQTTNTSINFSIPVNIPANDSVKIPLNSTIELASATGSERFDEMHIKAGSLPINISSNLNHKARIEINIPSLTKNGVPFKGSIYYNPSGAGYTTASGNFNLSGYKLVLYSSGGINNKINVNYSVTVFGDGIANLPSYSFVSYIGFAGIEFSKLLGYFGQPNFVIQEDTVDFNMYRNNMGGHFNFVDPKLTIFVTNSYGIPIDISFIKFLSRSWYNAPYTVNVSGPGLPNPWQIAPAPSLGSSRISAIYLNKSNSNIDDAVNISPQYAIYDVVGLANPAGNPSVQNFVADTSRFKVDVEFELPMWGTGKDFIVQDTLEMNFANLKEVEYVKLNIHATNGFPLEARFQVYFVDSLYHPMDSVFDLNQLIVPSAMVGNTPDLRVVRSSKLLTERIMSNERWAKLEKAKEVIFRATLASTNNGDPNYKVKLYSDYVLDIKMGVQIQLKVNSGDYNH